MISALEYAKYRIEETRRALMALNAKVELGTNAGQNLSEILCRAIDDVEKLAEEVEASE